MNPTLKKLLAAVTLTCICLSPAAGIAPVHAAPSVGLYPYDNSITGLEWPWNKKVLVTLTAPDGRLKEAAKAYTRISQLWAVERFWGTYPLLLPLDTVRVYNDGVLYCTAQVPVLTFNADPAGDVVRGSLIGGEFTPDNIADLVTVDFWGDRYVADPTPRNAAEQLTDVPLPVGPDGSFTIDLSRPAHRMNLKRNDSLFVSYRDSSHFAEGYFAVSFLNYVPGATVYKGTNQVSISGHPASSYTVTLRSSTGAFRARARSNATGGLQGTYTAFFLSPQGTPVRIRQGDRVTVSGPGAGFTVPVARLEAEVGNATVTGKARPGAVIRLFAQWFDDYGSISGQESVYELADAAGNFQHTFATAFTPGDCLELAVQNPQGNLVKLFIPIPPSSP